MSKDVKIAFIITAYNKPAQLARLVNCLGGKAGYENIYIHIDKKASYTEVDILNNTNHRINVFKKYPVYWGGNNQLLSILFLIEQATLIKKYDFIILLSGQDMPVVSFDEIKSFLKGKLETSFITSQKFPIDKWNYKNGFGRVQWIWFMDHVQRIRGISRFHKLSHYIFEKYNIVRPSSVDIDFYGGSDWWMLPGEVASYCLDQHRSNKKLKTCFKYSFIPSEMFFQTVIGGTKYQENVANNNYRFISWKQQDSGRPDTIENLHKTVIEKSGCLFARKFDLDLYPDVFAYFEDKF